MNIHNPDREIQRIVGIFFDDMGVRLHKEEIKISKITLQENLEENPITTQEQTEIENRESIQRGLIRERRRFSETYNLPLSILDAKFD